MDNPPTFPPGSGFPPSWGTPSGGTEGTRSVAKPPALRVPTQPSKGHIGRESHPSRVGSKAQRRNGQGLPSESRYIQREVGGGYMDRKCFRCGRHGHLASDCYARTHAQGRPLPCLEMEQDTCDRCGRNGHTVDVCFARTTYEGRPLPSLTLEETACIRYTCLQQAGYRFPEQAARNSEGPAWEPPGQLTCLRCSRTGHTNAECFARYTADGFPIPTFDTDIEEVWSTEEDSDLEILESPEEIESQDFTLSSLEHSPTALQSPGVITDGVASPTSINRNKTDGTGEGRFPNGRRRPEVYVLQLEGNKWYVGKSSAVESRIREHREGFGSAWTNEHLVIERVRPLTPPSEDLDEWERRETLARMYAHGISNVRGWKYTAVRLQRIEQEHARSDVCEKFDLCRKCGHVGHFAQQCTRRTFARWCVPNS